MLYSMGYHTFTLYSNHTLSPQETYTVSNIFVVAPFYLRNFKLNLK
jgi:hypothetical protein